MIARGVTTGYNACMRLIWIEGVVARGKAMASANAVAKRQAAKNKRVTKNEEWRIQVDSIWGESDIQRGISVQTFTFKTTIDEKRVLSLALPADIRPGAADVIVMLEDDESGSLVKPVSDEMFDALMCFGDGRRLGGLSIKEIAAEGRR